MTAFTVVLPSIAPSYTERCVKTMHPHLLSNLVVVDNTRRNRGVPASWNIGAQAAEAAGVDWLVIVSAGTRFGPSGGTDLIEQLDRHAHEIAVEADGGLGWHLIAVNMDAYRAVGPFDERFHPAYWEEADWAYRAYCLYELDPAGPWWPKVQTDARLAETAHAIKSGLVSVDFVANQQRYVAKHGGEPGHEAYRSTYGVCPVCYKVRESCDGHDG